MKFFLKGKTNKRLMDNDGFIDINDFQTGNDENGFFCDIGNLFSAIDDLDESMEKDLEFVVKNDETLLLCEEDFSNVDKEEEDFENECSGGSYMNDLNVGLYGLEPVYMTYDNENTTYANESEYVTGEEYKSDDTVDENSFNYNDKKSKKKEKKPYIRKTPLKPKSEYKKTRVARSFKKTKEIYIDGNPKVKSPSFFTRAFVKFRFD